MRRAGPAVVLVLAVVTSVALPAAPAAAHDRPEHVEPAAGAQVDREPGQVQLVFDQAVGRRFSTVVVTDPDGTNRAAGPCQVLDNTVTQPLQPAGPAGVYTVAYRIMSADGHPVTGSSTFTVTAAPAATTAPATTAPSPAGSNTATMPATPAAPTSTAPSPGAGQSSPPAGSAAAHAQHPHQHGLGGTGLALLALAGLGAASWVALRRRSGAGNTPPSRQDRP